MVGGVVSELGDGDAGPVGEVEVPGRPAVEDGDGFAAHVGLDPGLVAEVFGDSGVAELTDAGEVEVGNRAHPLTVGVAAVVSANENPGSSWAMDSDEPSTATTAIQPATNWTRALSSSRTRGHFPSGPALIVVIDHRGPRPRFRGGGSARCGGTGGTPRR